MIRPRAAPVKRTALWATAIVAIVGVTTISSDPSQARVIRNQNSNLTQVPQTARGYLVAKHLGNLKYNDFTLQNRRTGGLRTAR